MSGESISRTSSSIPAMSPEPISVGWTLYVRLKDGPGKESLIGGGNSFLRRHFAPNSRILLPIQLPEKRGGMPFECRRRAGISRPGKLELDLFFGYRIGQRDHDACAIGATFSFSGQLRFKFVPTVDVGPYDAVDVDYGRCSDASARTTRQGLDRIGRISVPARPKHHCPEQTEADRLFD